MGHESEWASVLPPGGPGEGTLFRVGGIPVPNSLEQPTLSEKRLAFVEAYLGPAMFNATRAAELAGYASPGQAGHRLLKNVEILAYIDDRLRSLALSSDQALAILRHDALLTDDDILAVAAAAPGQAAAAAAVGALITARSTARTNLLKAHQLITNRNVCHTGRIDHVHRVPQGLRHLTDDELDQLEAIAARAHDAEHEVSG